MNQPTKPTVHYRAVGAIVVGQRALVMPNDHTSPLVSNEGWATTSTVVAVHENGVFETQNTIYKPE